jgi:exodeoxyribonuclease VII large subunit
MPGANPMDDTYLTTNYRDREQVKALGARWDPLQKRWFVPTGRDLAPFAAWLSAEARLGPLTAPGPASTLLTTMEDSAGTALTVTPKGISLSRLLAGVAQAVAQAYPAGVWTLVEVLKADVRRGLVYLELAERNAQGDSVAQARAVIWAETANQIVPAFERATGAVLGAGIKLLVRARPNLHAQYGLSLVIDAIDPDYTLGDLEARKREIRERLQREGLFDANRRLPPPWDFNAVLVVAPQGAAGLGDFQAEAGRLEQFGLCRFVYAFSRFQGEGAAAEIVRALAQALDAWTRSGRPPPDAVVLLRGGGAVNDLAWLNDYDLARCLCESALPVFTGIGHERDNSVLDEVAHLRFDTPSKVIAGIEQLIVKRAGEAQIHFQQIAQLAQRVAQAAHRTLDQAESAVKADAQRHLASARERSGEALTAVHVGALQSVRDASDRTRELIFDVRQQSQAQLSLARQAVPARLAEIRSEGGQAIRAARVLAQSQFDAVLERAALDARLAAQATDRTLAELAGQARGIVADAATRSEALMREITGQGPDKTLGRGFAIVRAADGSTVTSAAQAPAGAAIDIEFRDGHLAARTLNPARRP